MIDTQPVQEIPVVRDLRAELEEAHRQTAARDRAVLAALFPSTGNLLRHAERELELVGPADDYMNMAREAALDLIRVFASQGHSGMSAGVVMDLFRTLASFDILTPLTGHPADWGEVYQPGGAKRLWQSTRKSSVFWREGEPTWYDLNDIESESQNTQAMSPPDPAR